MKYLILILITVLAMTNIIAQTDTTTLVNSDIKKWHQTDEKTWVFTLERDTLSNADTLFVGGDTILTHSDTLQIDFPNNFGTAFAAYAVINTDTIVGYTGMTGFYRFFQAACETCDYVPIIASTALTTPAQFLKSFDLHMIRLRLVLWTTGNTGQLWGNVVLKPSSITSD